MLRAVHPPQRSWLALVLLIGAALRLIGLSFGLDFGVPQLAIFLNQNDPESMAVAVRDQLLAGSVDPGVFLHWGTLGFYLFGLVDWIVFGIRGLVAGDGLAGELERLTANASPLLLVHRLVTVAASLATVVVVHRMARRDFGERVALIAAAILACCYLHARDAHFGGLDPLLLLFGTLALERSLAFVRQPATGVSLAAFAAAALAAATKYSGAVLFLLPLAAHAMAWRRGDRAERPRLGGLLLGLALGVGVFLAVSPQFLFALDDVRAVVGSQAALISLRWRDIPHILNYNLFYALRYGVGEAALPLGCIGIALLAVRGRSDSRWIWLLGCLLAAAMTFVVRIGAVRYVYSTLSVLAVGAALAIDRLAPRGAPRTRLLLPALLVLAVGPSLVRTMALDAMIARTDTRVDVLRMLAASGAPRTDVIGVGYYGLPRSSLVATEPPFLDYLVRRAFATDAAEQARLRALRPRFIVLDETSGVGPELGSADFDAVIRTEYREILRVDGRRSPGVPLLPDLASGTPFHFIPYASPWQMRRPGPVLAVYERRE